MGNVTPFAGGVYPSMPSFTGGSLDSAAVAANSSVIASSDYRQMLFDKTQEASRLDANTSSGEVIKKDDEYHYSENISGKAVTGKFMLASKGQILFETSEEPMMYRVPSRKAINQMTKIYARTYRRTCVGASTETENCQSIKAILGRYEPSALNDPAAVGAQPVDDSDPFAESNKAPDAISFPPSTRTRSVDGSGHAGGTASDSGRPKVEPTAVFKVWATRFDLAAPFNTQGEITSFATSFLGNAAQRSAPIECSAINRVTGRAHDGTDKLQRGFLTVKQEGGKKVFVLSGAGLESASSKRAATAELKIQEGNSGKKGGIAYLRASDPACGDPFFPDLDARQYEIRPVTGKDGRRSYMLHYEAPGLFDVYCEIPVEARAR